VNYTFFIEYHSIVTQVFPLNWLECNLIDEKERDQVFYRRKFEGSLTFGGKKLCEDFMLFWELEQTDPCGQINLLILQDLNIYWEGYFATSNGKWDLDAATFTVKPLTTDYYSELSQFADVQYNILESTPIVTTSVYGGAITYTHNRWLMDVIEYLADKISPGTIIASEFFTNAINPATLSTNLLTHLTIAQKSDIKRPTSSNPATTAMMSWNELMYILWGMFQVQWIFDGITITIEHISNWSSTAGIDLRTQEIAVASNKYRYLKEEMPKFEKFKWMEAYEENFIGVPIWYDYPCVNQDPESNVREIVLNVTTDLEYIQDSVNAIPTEESKISDAGFVILCNYISGGNNYIHYDQGKYINYGALNMHLSWANLHDNYYRHNRVLIEGYMNASMIPPWSPVTTFFSAQKTKVQEINAIVCLEYNPDNYITTELGEVYFAGEKGYVQKAIIKPYNEINFTLLYGPEGTENTGEETELEKIINITEVVSEAGLGLSHYYAVCNQPADADLHIDIYLTCQDEDAETCNTDTETINIPTGSTNGTCVVAWCMPVAKAPVCIAANHHDTSGAPGWTVIWHYDNSYYC